MSYSAGTAYLQVTPSFLGLDRALRRDVERMSRRIDDALADGVEGGLADRIRRATRGMERDGRDAGERFTRGFDDSVGNSRAGNALTRSMTRAIDSMMRRLPEITLTGDATRLQSTIDRVRNNLREIRDQHVNLEIDDDTASAAVQNALRDLRRGASGEVDLGVDAGNLARVRAAIAQSRPFEDLVDEARRVGREAGGSFAGEFGEQFNRDVHHHFDRVARSLPEIELRPDLTLFDHSMRSIRRQALELRDFRIGIDGDADDFYRAVARVEREMARLRAANVSVEFDADLDRANEALREFSTRYAPDAGGRAGLEMSRRMGAAFSRDVRNGFQRIQNDLPEIELRPDLTIFDHSMRSIRRQIQELRDFRIGVDGDTSAFFAAVRRVEREMQRLRDADVSPEFNLRLDRGLRELDDFATIHAPEAGRRAGENMGGELNTALGDGAGDAGRRAGDEASRGLGDALGDGADTAGRDAGRRTGDSLRQELDEAAQRAGEEAGRRLGDGTSREFDRRVSSQISRSIRTAGQNLPAIPIDADSTPAQHEYMRLREEIARIGRIRIVTELDAARVLAQVEVIQERVNRLDRDDVVIRLHTDGVAAAAVQLAAAGAAANALGGSGQVASVGLGRLGAIIAAVLSLGTALIPMAAAASFALAGIATAAIAGGAGLGVLILGLSGVVSGITALHKYQQDVDKSAKSFSQSQNQVTSAVDGVTSAEQSLANARANGAYASKQAAQAVVDASRAIVDAQRAVTEAVVQVHEAEKALDEARESARRRDEDRALAMRGNALSQRQAVLDLAEAKKDLDKVIANPAATEAEREAARITYERRRLQIDELSVAGKRLQQEQTEAAKKGVEGSDEVQAAHKRVAQAQQGVLDAQRGVADAQRRAAQAAEQYDRQRIENAQQVEAAQRQLAQAQRALQQATVNAGVAGGEAMDNLKDAMSSLSPEARRFVEYLYSMKDAALGLRQAAEKGMLPGFQQALRELMPAVPALEGFIFRLGQTIGQIAVMAVQSLRHPVWREFFGFISDTAGPALKGMWQFSEAVARGLASLIMALSSFNGSMGRGLIAWAEGFALWARELSSSSGFQKFIAYVKQEGPEVIDFLGSLSEMIKRIVIAAAPIGSFVLRAVDALVDAFNAIPLPILTFMLAWVAAFALRFLTAAAVMGIFTRSQAVAQNQTLLLQRAQAVLAGTLTVYRTAAAGATTSTTILGRAMGVAAGSAAIARGAFSSVLGALGGPWGLALTAATFLLFSFTSQTEDQAQKNQDLKKSMLDLVQVYTLLGTGQTGAAQDMILQNSRLRELIDSSRQYGISVTDMVGALKGDADARQRVVAAYDAEIAKVQARDAALDNEKQRDGERHTDFLARVGREHLANRKQIEDLQAQKNAVVDVGNEQTRAAELAGALAGANQDLGIALVGVQKAMSGGLKTAGDYAGVLDAIGLTSASAEGKAGALAIVMQSIGNSALTAEEKSKLFAQAIALIGDTSGDAATKGALFATAASRIADSTVDGAQKAQLFHDVLEGLGSSSKTSGPVFDSLASSFTSIARSSIDARDKVSLLKQAMDQMYGAAMAQTDADIGLVRAKQDLRVQLASNSAGFDLNTAAGGKNTDAILANIEALKAAYLKAREKYVQDLANGVAMDVARAAYDRNIAAIEAGIPKTQRGSDAVKNLNATYGAIPLTKETEISTPGLDKAFTDLIEAHAVQEGLTKGWSRDLIEAEIQYLKNVYVNNRTGQAAMRKAAGGLVDGWSPSRTADNIPAWLTAKEFVHPVDTVEHYGVDVMEGLRTKKIPREVFSKDYMYAQGGYVDALRRFGSLVPMPIPIKTDVKMPVTAQELWKQWDAKQSEYGPGPGFPPWPSAHPGAGGPSGDSGVWRSIVALIKSTGPLSGSFGNGYRPGDPLWHGAGRAVDWMGFKQDALASFFMNMRGRVLELIHRTPTRDYAVTRGRDRGSFNNNLMNEHKNHVHIAMAKGGLVPQLFDSGGYLKPGWNPPIWNGTGKPEPVLSPSDYQMLHNAAKMTDIQGPRTVHNWQFANTTMDAGRLRALNDREAALSRDGRAR